jgi:hypothetical protein
MLVSIDESGDAGFRLDRGASPIFAAAMVIFRNQSEAERAAATIRMALVDLRVSPEFKFSGCRGDARDGFFIAVRSFDFRVRALVTKKAAMGAVRPWSGKEAFYNDFIRTLIQNAGLVDAKVVIDGSGARSFQRVLKSALLAGAPPGAVRRVQFKDSRRTPIAPARGHVRWRRDALVP